MKTTNGVLFLVLSGVFAACGPAAEGIPEDGGAGVAGSGSQAGGAGGGGGQATGGAGMIGPEGGTVVQADGKVALTFSTGAVSQPIAPQAVPTSAPGAIPGTAYDLSPEGTPFAAATTLTIAYDPAALPPGTDESRLRLVTLTSQGLELGMPNTMVDVSRHTVTARIAHFSTWYLTPPSSGGGLAVELVGDNEVHVKDTTDDGVLRAFVPACSSGAICLETGCRREDFSPDLAVRPPGVSTVCLNSERSDHCPPPPDGRASDMLSSPGFYCYRAGTETVELFSTSGVAVPMAPAPVVLSADPHSGDGSVVVSWRPIPGNEADILGYTLFGGGGGGQFFPGAGPDAYVDTHLDPGAEITYTLVAKSASGKQTRGATVTITTQAPLPGVPAAPTVTWQATATTITLNWTSSVPSADFYDIDRVAGAGFSTSGFTIVDTDLSPGKTYTYVVWGVNGIGSGAKTLVRATTGTADGQ